MLVRVCWMSVFGVIGVSVSVGVYVTLEFIEYIMKLF